MDDVGMDTERARLAVGQHSHAEYPESDGEGLSPMHAALVELEATVTIMGDHMHLLAKRLGPVLVDEMEYSPSDTNEYSVDTSVVPTPPQSEVVRRIGALSYTLGCDVAYLQRLLRRVEV